jgi:5-methyltetrahydropteroyltriglutamate--homocysteine methyltransferase
MSKIARADVIGSLLRPSWLLEARREGRAGNLSAAKVREVEDRAVREAIALQEDCGLDAVTDGEFRRFNFVATVGVRNADDGCLSGFSTVEADRNFMGLWKMPDGSFGGFGQPDKGMQSIVTEKISLKKDLVADEFVFLKANTKRARPKFTFPAPSWHRANWHPDFSRDAYPDVRDFLDDISEVTRQVLTQLVAAGCEYIHLDAPNYAQWHIDPAIRDVFESWGRDLDAELIEDAEIDNALFDGIPGIGEVTRGLHLCRGNAPGGRWLADGGYGAIAERLFPRLSNYNALLLEYDSPRAGDFSPLAHVPGHMTAVLGLVTTKDGALEDAAELKARIGAAAKVLPLDQLALSPQCGFASGEYATTMTPEQQAAKLRLVGHAAADVWRGG